MKVRKTREQIFEDVRQILSLVDAGSSTADACEKVGVPLPSYYKYRKIVREQSLPVVAGTHEATVVKVHEPVKVTKIKRKSFDEAPRPVCAVFVGDSAQCARFLKEFQ